MIESFAQILDEAYWGLKAEDSVQAMWHLEAIKELIAELEESLKAGLIPEEMVVI